MREESGSLEGRVHSLRELAERRKMKAGEIEEEIRRLIRKRDETIVEARACVQAADELEAAGMRQAAE